MPAKDNKNQKDYEKMGHMLEDIYWASQPSRRALYKTSFIKGLIGGFGGVLGATILVAAVLWFMAVFERVPLIGPFVDAVRRTVDQSN